MVLYGISLLYPSQGSAASHSARHLCARRRLRSLQQGMVSVQHPCRLGSAAAEWHSDTLRKPLHHQNPRQQKSEPLVCDSLFQYRRLLHPFRLQQLPRDDGSADSGATAGRACPIGCRGRLFLRLPLRNRGVSWCCHCPGRLAGRPLPPPCLGLQSFQSHLFIGENR